MWCVKGCADDWGCMAWTPSFLEEKYGDVEVEIKFERKQVGVWRVWSECGWSLGVGVEAGGVMWW